MAQAVYASFCHCFPDSYRQFGEDFRDAIVFLVFGWMAGRKTAVFYLKYNECPVYLISLVLMWKTHISSIHAGERKKMEAVSLK